MTAPTVHQDRARSRARSSLDADALRAAGIDERVRAIEEFICHELTRVLDVPPAHRIDPQRPLHTQGVGSIMGLQLKRLLEIALDVDVEVVQVLREESVAELAANLALRLDDPLGGEAVPTAPTAPSASGGRR